MPTYQHPGVYIEEQPAPQTIEGVSTSTAGLVGVTKKGPTSGLPQLVTSFSDFIRKYGDRLDEKTWGDHRFLAYAVDGFFNNGGQLAYIMRVVGNNALSSSLTLNDGYVTRLEADTSADVATRNTVRLVSLLGVSVGTTLRFEENIAGIAEQQDVAVTGYVASSRSVTLAATLNFQFTASGCTVRLFGVVPLPSAGNPSLTIRAANEGKWGDSIVVDVTNLYGAVGLTEDASVETTLAAAPLAFDTVGPAAGVETIDLDADSYDRLTNGDQVEFDDGAGATETVVITKGATPTIDWVGALVDNYSGAGSSARQLTGTLIAQGANNPVVQLAATTSFSNGDLGRVTRGEDTQLVRISNVDGANSQVTLDTGGIYAIARGYNAGDSFTLATAGRSGTRNLRMRSINSFYPGSIIEIDDRTTKSYHTVDSTDGTQLVLVNNLNRDVPSGTTVRLVEFNLTADDGTISEEFRGLSLAANAPRFVEEVVNLQSRLITATSDISARAVPFNLPRTVAGLAVTLTGGADGSQPTVEHYRGEDNGPGLRTGIKALADIDRVAILAAPGRSDLGIHQELVGQCQLLKDRFAVLDPRKGSVMGSGNDFDIEQQRSNIDSLYGAIYYPWMRVADPLYPNDAAGRLVPPSGHMIGIYARTDRERGVHKAPANTVIRGINGLEFKLSDREQDILNPANINVLRDFRDSNRGIRVWGARCTTSDVAWRYIPVRRLFIMVEESLEEGLQWVVFEPNGAMLWARVRRTITGFLRGLWLNGALAGVTEDQAFFVRCGIPTTMSEEDVNLGRLIVLVGIATLKPAEFVIIRISQKTLEAAG